MGNRIAELREPSGRPSNGVKTAPSWAGKRVGRFKLISELGRGAMGRVFRAEDTLLHRHVALKVLPKVLRRGAKTIAVERLVAEARAAATLEHPHVVSVYEVNESAGVFYIAMELLAGGSLRDIVKAAGPMDYPKACLLCADAADALAHAHAEGIVHRDIKPANLMLTRSGRCKVVDFGLARMDDASDMGSRMSESVGTPQFIASELLRGIPASERSDIYSLGATLWYLLVGRPPFEGNSAGELLQQHLESPLPDLAALRPDLPAALVKAINKAMSKRPSDRFDSADQFEKVLRVFTIPAENSAAGSLSALMSVTEPAHAPEPHPPAAVAAAPGNPLWRWKWPPSRPVTIGAGVAAAIVLCATLIPMLTGISKTPRSASAHSTAAVGATRRDLAAPDPMPLPPTDDDSRAVANRGSLYARRGQFTEASSDYANALKINPKELTNWYYRACLAAYTGDAAAYRATCQGMFQQFSGSQNATFRDKTAKTCGLLEDSGVDSKDLLMVAESLPPDGNSSPELAAWYSLCKGIALYRCGKYDDCIEMMQKARSPDRIARAGTAQLVEAMAQWRKGMHTEAQSTFREAADRLDRGMARPGVDDLARDGLEDWLICQVFRRQAQKLIPPVGR